MAGASPRNCTDLKPYDLRESEIRDMIYEYLCKRQIFCWRDRQGVGKPSRGTLTGNQGVADILGIYRGKALGIEVKKKGGDLSIAQFEWLTEFRRQGGIAFIATSIEDVQRKLSEVDATGGKVSLE